MPGPVDQDEIVTMRKSDLRDLLLKAVRNGFNLSDEGKNGTYLANYLADSLEKEIQEEADDLMTGVVVNPLPFESN